MRESDRFGFVGVWVDGLQADAHERFLGSQLHLKSRKPSCQPRNSPNGRTALIF
jgi:hypothetical protein